MNKSRIDLAFVDGLISLNTISSNLLRKLLAGVWGPRQFSYSVLRSLLEGSSLLLLKWFSIGDAKVRNLVCDFENSRGKA